MRKFMEYYRDEPALDNNNIIINFPNNNNNSILFKFKQQITGRKGNSGKKRCTNNDFIKISE